jgi:hypothetical protein
MDYHNKYIKYKQKYLKLKNQHGGVLPYVMQKDKTPDYFPFDNNKFNYYNDNYSLIVNDSSEDYLLNKRFELVKLDSEKLDKTVYNNNNMINDNNIYKLADEQITISDKIKIPFHLCLLSEYKILDEIYKIHIKKDLKNFLINNAKTVFTKIYNFSKDNPNEIENITYNYNILLKYSYCNKFLELLQLIYDIQTKIISQIVIDKITTISDLDKQIIESYNLKDYIIINIINFFIDPESLLKKNFIIIHMLYKEKLLIIEEEELSKKEKSRIEKEKEKEEKSSIEQSKKEKSKIEEEKSRIEKEKSKIEEEKSRIEKEKLKIEEEKSRIEKEKLKIEEKKSRIEEEKSRIKDKLLQVYNQDYNNAVQTYINISDTTLLFKLIKDDEINSVKDPQKSTNSSLKEAVLIKIKKMTSDDLNNDLKPFSNYLNDDIKDIKQLLLFNLYIDKDNIKDKDLSPNFNFSYIFYATFIYYRINEPLIEYPLFRNLYPINKNNFICNLIGIDKTKLSTLRNISSNNILSNNQKMFRMQIENYIKHPIHDYEGIVIHFKYNSQDYSYTNCVENGILEFIKILFWNQKEFEIKLPDENKNNETTNERFKLLKEIFNDINSNLENKEKIESLYKKTEYHDKIHKLFSNHDTISYSKIINNYKYEMNSSMEIFLKMLRIILNFETEEELKKYLGEINKYNKYISEIKFSDRLLEIFIQNNKLFTISISPGHTELKSLNNTNIDTLIEYDYFNLLIYNSNIISIFNINEDECKIFINFYNRHLYEKQNNKSYKYFLQLIIIKYPKLTANLENDYMEIIISAYNKNPEILLNIFINNDEKNKFFSDILSKIKEEDINYEIIVKNIISVRPKFIKDISSENKFFSEILINNIKIEDIFIFDIYYNIKKNIKSFDKLLDDINKNFPNHQNYSDLVITILSFCPELIKKFDKNNKNFLKFKNFSEIVIKSNISQDNKLVEYLFNEYKYKNNSKNILNILNKTDKNELYYKDLVICIIRICSDIITIKTIIFNIVIFLKDFSEIIINITENINVIVDYLDYLDMFYLPKLLDGINKNHSNHDNYKNLVLCIIRLRPDLIKKINKDHKDFEEIVFYNIIKDKLNCKIVNYIFQEYGEEYILSLLEKFSKHDNYKDFAVCIIHYNPDLIKIINKDHKDFSYIIINSIKNDNKINIGIVNYLNNFDSNYIINLLDDINKDYSDHDNYKDLVIFILGKYPELIDMIDENHINYSEIIINSIISTNEKDVFYCNIIDHIIKKYGEEYDKSYKYVKKIYFGYNFRSHSLAICILRIFPQFIRQIIEDFFINRIHKIFFYEIIINSINVNVNDENNYQLFNYLNNEKDLDLNEILDNINELYLNHYNYKNVVICIIRFYPKLIRKINKDHKDFSYIIINSIKNDNKINIGIVNYLNELDANYISKLLDNINKDYSDHDNYKDFVICILGKYPKFITNIDIKHKDFPEIVINSINDEQNCKIVNYLNKLDTNYISKLLNNININHSNHDNYKNLVICIIRLHPILIKTINKYNKDYLEIVINSINVDDENNCEIVDHIIDINNDTYFDNLKKILLLDKLKKEYSGHQNYSKLVKCINRKKKIFFTKIFSKNNDGILNSSK